MTFPLIVLGLLIAMGLGIPLGCEATLARSRAARGMFHMVAIIGGAVPALWGGLLLILLFMLAAFFLLIGLLVDLLHRVLDPRLKSADDVTEVNA